MGWCIINGQGVSSDVGPSIRDSIHGSHVKEQLGAKGILVEVGWNAIDWDALEEANQGFPKLFQLWAAKHASGFCVVGKMMKCWGYWQSNDCLCCWSGVVETPNHILWCLDQCMMRAYEGEITKLVDWLEEGTHLEIAEVWKAYL